MRHAGNEHDRQEHADRRERRREQRAGNLTYALNARGQNRQMLLVAQTVNVFDRNDRVVHQHTYTQRQTRQRQNVQRDARKIHAHERSDHAQRNGERDNDRRSVIHQEDQQNQNRKRAAADQIAQHRINDNVDVIALIEQIDDRKPRFAVHQFRVFFGNALGNIGRRERGLLFNRKENAVFAVDLRKRLGAVIGNLHARNVAKAHVVHALKPEREELYILQFVQTCKLIAHANHILVLARIVNIARRHGHILRAQNGCDGLHGDHAVQSCVLERLIALFFKFPARFGELCGGVIQLLLRVGKAALRLSARFGELILRIGKGCVLIDALDHAAGNNTLFELSKHRINLLDARFQLGLRLNRLRVLSIALVVVERELQRLVFIRGFDFLNRLVHFGNRRAQRFRRRSVAAGKLLQTLDFLVQRRNAQIDPRNFALSLLNAPLDVSAAEIVQRLLLRVHLRVQVIQRRLFFIHIRLRRGNLFFRRRKRRLRVLQLRAKLLLGLALRLSAKPPANAIDQRYRFRFRIRRQHGNPIGRICKFRDVRSQRAVRFIRRRNSSPSGCGRHTGFGIRRRNSEHRIRILRAASRILCRHGGRHICRWRGGRFRCRRSGCFRCRRIGRFCCRLSGGRFRRRGRRQIFQLPLQLINLLLRRIALGLRGSQILLRESQRSLRVCRLRLQRRELLFERRCVRILQIFNILLQVFLLCLQFGFLGFRRLDLLVNAPAIAVFQRVERLLKPIALRAEFGELALQRAQKLLLLRRKIRELFQLRNARIHLIELRLKLRLLCLQLRNRSLNLFFAGIKPVFRIRNLPERALFRAGKLIFAVCDLRLRVVKLLLRIGKLGIHLAQNCAVQRIDSILIDRHVHFLRNHAGGRYRRDAVDRLVFGNQRVFNIIGQFVNVHILTRNRHDRHRQHIRIDLHHRRRTDGIAPSGGQRRDL